jgi:hypothetical protein
MEILRAKVQSSVKEHPFSTLTWIEQALGEELSTTETKLLSKTTYSERTHITSIRARLETPRQTNSTWQKMTPSRGTSVDRLETPRQIKNTWLESLLFVKTYQV